MFNNPVNTLTLLGAVHISHLKLVITQLIVHASPKIPIYIHNILKSLRVNKREFSPYTKRRLNSVQTDGVKSCSYYGTEVELLNRK